MKETEKSLEFLQCLNSVKLHAPGAPIIMVGTRMDQLSNEKSDLKKVNQFLRDGLQIVDFNIVENRTKELFFFPIDNMKKLSKEALNLRQIVLDAARGLDCVDRQVPLTRLKVLDVLFFL